MKNAINYLTNLGKFVIGGVIRIALIPVAIALWSIGFCIGECWFAFKRGFYYDVK